MQRNYNNKLITGSSINITRAALLLVLSLVLVLATMPPASVHLLLNGLLGALMGYFAFPAVLVALYMLKLYLYGYLNRIRSSRRLEAEAGRNLDITPFYGNWPTLPRVTQGNNLVIIGKAEKDGKLIDFNIKVDKQYQYLAGEYVGDERKGIVEAGKEADLEMTFHFDGNMVI